MMTLKKMEKDFFYLKNSVKGHKSIKVTVDDLFICFSR